MTKRMAGSAQVEPTPPPVGPPCLSEGFALAKRGSR